MQWSDDAVVYQIYLRSFADADGDGIGDLAGLRSRLGYLRSLGVDALWLNPCFRSPQVDHGYDVSDYFTIDPAYGDLAAFDALLATAHEQGLRVLLDLVPNHCSTQHPWFLEAAAAPPGSPERARFHFRPGRGPAGDEPPNNWQSVFGGPAWTRLVDGPYPGDWYLHAFDPAQPDFNWANPEVEALFDDVLRFWFARGVDGFRVDVAHGLHKHPDLADWPGGEGTHNAHMWNQAPVHDVYRRWRKIADEYDAAFVGEVWVPSAQELAPYQSPDELGQVFSFDLLVQPWHGPSLREAIDRTQAMVGADSAAAWVLANHDVHRAVTRYGQEQVLDAPDATDMIAAARREGPADLELGTRRARAAVMLLLALPGAAYLYQGEELGLPEVLDLPDGARQDPIWLRSGGTELGRDGCRVPMPWTPDGPTLGFSPDDSRPAWLPQPATFAALAVSNQDADPRSMLTLYRRAVAARRTAFPASEATRPLHWIDTGDEHVVAFRRGSATCVVTTGTTSFPLPPAWGDVLLASGPVADGTLPPDACAWLSAVPDGEAPHPLTPAAAGTTKES